MLALIHFSVRELRELIELAISTIYLSRSFSCATMLDGNSKQNQEADESNTFDIAV